MPLSNKKPTGNINPVLNIKGFSLVVLLNSPLPTFLNVIAASIHKFLWGNSYPFKNTSIIGLSF
ncbi:hypothetical protein COS78_01090 [Candidatus Shapirobacteria bacterium CG06_land_8_20_14_3_00_40_12]|uniref:Uncharacterized protein n=2 Tax=Candidatus Shapironibacteriota TaxID=1752721 RepID=A0A2M7TTP0_9BACT|nr:MAG: hypothetical protein COS78_01090 [Candidatus Shapirobacteria bacterium CG06_land_8_20_14_3_00_40_12]PIZ59866.1 MAG: hypothetical protein COY20_01550 [Candidatus Shapirobacteria bacterium CG_4_10_14_0_2_um_filter_40_12]